MLENIGRTIADKAGSDERTLTVSVAAVGVSVVVASVFVWALWHSLRTAFAKLIARCWSLIISNENFGQRIEAT
jgi:hypothetical protein